MLELAIRVLKSFEGVEQLQSRLADLLGMAPKLLRVLDCELDSINRHSSLIGHFEIYGRWSAGRFDRCQTLSYGLGLH